MRFELGKNEDAKSKIKKIVDAHDSFLMDAGKQLEAINSIKAEFSKSFQQQIRDNVQDYLKGLIPKNLKDLTMELLLGLTWGLMVKPTLKSMRRTRNMFKYSTDLADVNLIPTDLNRTPNILLETLKNLGLSDSNATKMVAEFMAAVTEEILKALTRKINHIDLNQMKAELQGIRNPQLAVSYLVEETNRRLGDEKIVQETQRTIFQMTGLYLKKLLMAATPEQEAIITKTLVRYQ